MPDLPAFRHDPVKSVLPGAVGDRFRWDGEPVVCGYRRLQHHSAVLGRDVPVPVSATPAVLSGVGVVVASDDGYVRLYDPSLTKVYWERRMDSSVYASLVVDRERRRVVVTATSGLMACFDLRGSLVWSAQSPTPVCATPTVLAGADLLVVPAFASRCLGVRLSSGALVFDRPVPEPWSAAYGGTVAHRDPYASPVVTTEGNAIVCCAEHVLCLAPDGSEVWRQEIGSTVKASPATVHATGEVAVCAVDGRCVFLSVRTGEVRGELFLGGKVTASPAVCGAVLAVGTQNDAVTGIDVHTRQPSWQSQQGAPRSYTGFTVTPAGDFVATSARGNAVCLRAHDGRFLWESSQVLGLADHEPEMDITPVVGDAGDMYCASYTGVVYHFQFRARHAEENPCR
ncbi:PQQ-binding-like beta-propeller repeat protein [Streptomyces sp. NBC_01190]|uniref:outer membrane protein assembly factor BamB family protein n=1 Tax=Streptomyces sp. NBC_01190 TaxID=2903767 RepID=UPI0038673D26|nr:PQQ-like beta-propeller repeat protein [Streptomyces sp. NBC_01190]